MTTTTLTSSSPTITTSTKQRITSSASAPGKLILFGEHAVVYNQPAIAASLSDLRIQIDVSLDRFGTDGQQGQNYQEGLSIELPDLKPEPLSFEFANIHHLKVDRILNSYHLKDDSNHGHLMFQDLLLKNGVPSLEDASDIRHILQYHSLSDDHITTIVPLLFLINTTILPLFESQNQRKNTNVVSKLSIRAKSKNLPLGAGLGSSAAFSVAASAALYQMRCMILDLEQREIMNSCHQNNLQQQKTNISSSSSASSAFTTIRNNEFRQPPKEDLDIINRLAFYSETLIHGTPSGIDNTVSTYGGAVQYIKSKKYDDDDKSIKSEEEKDGVVFLDNFPQMNVILTNTNVPRSTRKLVHSVKMMKEQYPGIVDPILDSIGNISRTFRKDILQDNSQSNHLIPTQMKQISKLIQINQSLLCALGVSHMSLNTIVNLTESLYDEFKCSTKLTGAGGGGCAFTFLEDNDEDVNDTNGLSSDHRLKIVREKIEALKYFDKNDATYRYFQCFTTDVGGVGVLWSNDIHQ